MAEVNSAASVELAVIEFPGSHFNGEIVPELVDIVNRGIVTILDLVFVIKEPDGLGNQRRAGQPRRGVRGAVPRPGGRGERALERERPRHHGRLYDAGNLGRPDRVGEHMGAVAHHRGRPGRGPASGPRPARRGDGTGSPCR